MAKRCPRCETEKPVDGGFYVLKDGRVSGWCRECVRADKRQRYADRPEVRARAIEQATAYREEHREQLSDKQREWEQRNAVRRKAQRQTRRRGDDSARA